jgi:hypothetical protein
VLIATTLPFSARLTCWLGKLGAAGIGAVSPLLRADDERFPHESNV